MYDTITFNKKQLFKNIEQWKPRTLHNKAIIKYAFFSKTIKHNILKDNCHSNWLA